MQAEAAIARLEDKAAEVAAVLRMLANEKRLLILCHLAKEGEISVTPLAERVGLSQSALSQHLARLREDGLVATRRESQVHHYRISDERVGRLLASLYGIYCAEDQRSPVRTDRPAASGSAARPPRAPAAARPGD